MFATPLHETFQTPLRLPAGCSLAQAAPQTLLDALYEHVVALLLVFAQPSYVAHRRTLRYLGQRPSVGLTQRCFFGLRLYGQLAEGHRGLDETLKQQGGGHTFALPAQGRHADTLLCEREVLVAATVRFGYDASSFGVAHLPNLHEHFRGRLQSTALRFRGFQSNFLPFRSPITGS